MGGYPTDEIPNDLLQGMERRRSEQAAALQAVQQDMTKDLQAKQQEFQARQGDVNMSDRLLKMLDPSIPKPARQFLYRELTTSMGVDPKGDTSKAVGQLLLSLDPEAAEGLRRTFGQKLASAKPGEITGLVKGVLTGDVDGMQLLSLVQPAAARSGAPEETERASSVPGTVVAQGAAEPLDAGARRRLPTVGETPIRHGDANPQLVDALGLDYDADRPPRTSDILRSGFRVPLDPKEQQKLATEIQEGSASTSGTILNAARLNAIVAGRPEVLGPVGRATRWIDEAVSTAHGIFRQLTPNLNHETNPESVRPLAKKAIESIDRVAGRTNFKRTAEDAARAENGLIAMAYSMASARGIPGNRLTNAIIAQHLREIGASASPEQLQAKLADTVRRSIEQNSRLLQAKIGKPVPIDFRSVTDEDLRLVKNNDKVIPEQFMKQMDREVVRRMRGEPRSGTDINRASPTIEEEERLQQEDARRRERREQTREEREKQDLELKQQRELRQGRGELRAEERLARQAEQSDRQYQLALRKEERLEKQKRQDQIRRAFLELGRAVAASARTSVGGVAAGGGGAQDAGAFRLTPGPRRAAPAPVDAARFQRQRR